MGIQKAEIASSPISRAQANDFVSGVIDLHVHGPDKIPRLLNPHAHQLLQEANRIQAIVLKSHFRNSHDDNMVVLARKLPEKLQKPQVYGSLTLNQGFRADSVKSALKQAQGNPIIVWGPTIAAQASLSQTEADYAIPPSWVKGSKFPPIPKHKITPITCLGQNKQLTPAALDVLQTLQGTSAILASGHLGPDETFILGMQARSRQIPFIATHVLLGDKSPLTPKKMHQLTSAGAYLEFCYIFLKDEDYPGKYNRKQIVAQIKHYLPQVIISSDCGQAHNPGPAACLAECVRVLATHGLSLDEMQIAMIKNPHHLLGVKP